MSWAKFKRLSSSKDLSIFRRGTTASDGGGGGGNDPDAQAYIDALDSAGYTVSGAEETAINTFVVDLKADGIWAKSKAIYPFIGGTAATHKFNLKDPRDLDAAFRLTFFGGWTHSATGSLPNGTNGYADTFIKKNTMAGNSVAFGAYIRNNDTSIRAEMGVTDVGGWNTLVSGVIYSAINNSNPQLVGSIATSVGFTHSTLTPASAFHEVYRNGSLFATCAAASGTGTVGNTHSYYIAAHNNYGSTQWYSNKELALAFFSDGIDATESANLYTAVQALQTALNREV